MAHAVGGVEHVQGAEREHRHRDAEDHRQRLQQRRRAAVARVDGGGERQPRRRGPGQVGEHADDLRPEVVATALTAQRLARIGSVFLVGARTEPDELADDLVGVRGERDLAGRPG